MNEIRIVWIVRGYLDENTSEFMYEHAFPTKEEAMAIQRRGKTELPMLDWTLDGMNYGNMDFANHMFDELLKGGSWNEDQYK
jgi:hypothetical protein